MFKPHYKERFLRSIGIFNENELEKIRQTPIAIGGLGMGGTIFLNLVRLGFENFHVADPDTFERTNINRQRMAKENTLGRRKDECSIEEALQINPDVKVKAFPDGVNSENIAQFLDGIQWVVDVVDVFALKEKMALNAGARQRDIPVISCGALGFAGSMVVFNRNTPSFAELTGMKEEDSLEVNLDKFLRFIAPEIPEYMYDQITAALNKSTYIPFVPPGNEIVGAFCSTEIVKTILNRGERAQAPYGVFVDAFNLNLQIFRADHRVRSLQKPHGALKKAA